MRATAFLPFPPLAAPSRAAGPHAARSAPRPRACPAAPPCLLSARAASQTPPRQPRTSAPAATLTSLANNSFTLTLAGKTLLIDPWLHDDLVFLTPSFFRASKPPSGLAAAAALDLSSVSAVVLTQALADHAHPPTLAKLPRSLPVFAPRAAAPLLTALGFRHVTLLEPGDVVRPCPNDAPDLVVTVARGSLVGPPWSAPQLAFLFEVAAPDGAAAVRVYHEPHGNHDAAFLERVRGTLDAVMTPLVSTTIPALAGYALVNGVPEAVQLCLDARPRTCVLFDNSGGAQSGLLPRLLRTAGGLPVFESTVAGEDALRDMQVVLARPGVPVRIVGRAGAGDA